MAVKYAIQSGAWSDPATWNGGTLPAVGDSVHSNTYGITIDQDVNLGPSGIITNRANGSAAVGGYFVISSNRTIVANIIGGYPTLLYITGNNKLVNITGDVEGGNLNSNAVGITIDATNSVINITGQVRGGTSGGDCTGISMGGISSTVNIVGDCVGGTSSWSAAVFIPGGIVNVVGNCIGGQSPYGNAAGVATYGSSAIANIVGNIYAAPSASQGHGIYAYQGYVTVTGNCYSNTTNAIRNIGGATTINGDVFAAAAAGVYNEGFSYNTLVVNGAIYPSSQNYGVHFISGASCYIRKVATNNSPTYVFSLFNLTTENSFVEEVEIDSFGRWPINGFAKYPASLPIKKVTVRLSDGSPLTLSSNVGMPLPSNVKKGVVYDSGNKTGTLEIPPKEAVALGVLVGNEVGEAVLTFDGWLTALAASNNPMATRLKNVSTVQSTGEQLEQVFNS